MVSWLIVMFVIEIEVIGRSGESWIKEKNWMCKVGAEYLV